MNILEIVWEYPPHVVGGIGSHIAALAPELSRLGASVHVLTPRLREAPAFEIVAHGLKIHRVAPPVLSHDVFVDAQQTNVCLEQAADELFAQSGPFDVIHAHDWLVALAAITLKQRYKIPLTATIHATERGRWQGQLHNSMSHSIANMEWWLTYEAWRVITVSQFMAQELRDYFHLPADKIDVVPNGVDTAPFDWLDAVNLAEFRARYAEPQQPIIFSVGRMVYEKGTHLLLAAAPRILAEIPNVCFVLAGTGPRRDALVERVKLLGLEEQIKLIGFVSDADRNALFRVANCVALPSLYEPFGIVALEAMAARCPVVVSSVGGFAEVVQHEETGLTVYPNSAEALAGGILRVLQHPAEAHVRTQRAYHYVQHAYNWRHIAEQTLERLQRVVSERKRVVW
jgi:glycosyltransferase involved in cell wall biosynthesis